MLLDVLIVLGPVKKRAMLLNRAGAPDILSTRRNGIAFYSRYAVTPVHLPRVPIQGSYIYKDDVGQRLSSL